MTRVAGKLGRLPKQRPVGLKDLIAYATPLPSAPPSLNLTGPASTVYPMAGNDSLSDCTIAAVVHCDEAWCGETQEPYTYPGDHAVKSTYFALTGGGDTGLVEADVLSTWYQSGLFGNEIAGYAPVNVADTKTLKSALWLFGGLYVGIDVPAPAMGQFNAHQPWDLTGTSADDNIEGGHAIPLLGYDAEGLICVTWGATQRLTWRWWAKYAEEAWAVLSAQFVADPHLDLGALRADLDALGRRGPASSTTAS